jgi:hypothetical protein
MVALDRFFLSLLTVDVDDETVFLGLAGEVFVDGPAGQILSVVFRQRNEPDLGRGQHRLRVVVDAHVVVAENRVSFLL